MSEIVFDHEKLLAYQKAIEYVNWAHEVILMIKAKNSIVDQFDRAIDSIA